MTTTGKGKGRPKWPFPDAYIDVEIGGETRRFYGRMSAHKNGQWCKKIPGTNQLMYFGPHADPDAAVAKWRAVWPSIVGGEGAETEADYGPTLNVPDGPITVRDLGNLWYAAKELQAGDDELSPNTLRKYQRIAREFCHSIGRDRLARSIGPKDFQKFRKILSKYTMSARADFIIHTRGMFKWALESHLIDRLPDYGPDFKQPGRVARRKALRERRAKIIPAADIRYLRVVADPHLRACIMLGINAGLYTMDIAALRPPVLDLDNAVIVGERQKTGVPFYVTLWPETVADIRAVACESGPALQWRGRLPWNGGGTDRISREFKALRESLGLEHYTHGWFRHTLRTIGGQVNKDAVKRMMGQVVDDELDEIYDHRDVVAESQRLIVDQIRQVSEHVRWWLFTSQ